MNYSNLQSRDNSVVIEMNLLKDTKEEYNYFKSFFHFLPQLNRIDLLQIIMVNMT